jgi:hypothetical protein
MPPRLATSFITFVLGAAVIETAALAQQPTEAKALLRGLEQSRKNLHGKLRLRVETETLLPKREKGVVEVSVEFDREMWRFIQVARRVVSPADKAAARDRVIESHGGDPRAAERAGLGKVVDVRTISLFDGSQLMQYSDTMGGYIIVHQNGSAYLCFDVRLLGLARSHSPNYNLSECLGLGTSDRNASVVGPEQVDGYPVWHVMVSSSRAEVDYHFWISDTDGFRVHRYEYRHPRDGSSIHLVSKMEYANGGEHVLPTRVILEELSQRGKKKQRQIITVFDPDYEVRPDPSIFGFKGLEMPPGTMVIDERVHRVAGYFNGTDLSADPGDALSQSAQMAAAEVNPFRLGWWFYTVVAVVVLLVGILGFRRLARRQA